MQDHYKLLNLHGLISTIYIKQEPAFIFQVNFWHQLQFF